MFDVAILGAGIGAQHLQAYLALPERFRVAAICDLDENKARALASRTQACAVLSDVDAIVSDPAVDILDICLPPHLHGPIALKAFAAGKHVICEKPVAGSVAEADRMLEASISAGRLFAPIFQYRYGRGLYQLAALQERGLVGRPLVATLETHWNRGADYYAVPWRGKWASERGGAVLGHAIHIHDLVTAFFGPVTEVTAILDTRVNPIETEDCAAISMRTVSGGLVTSSVTLGGAGDRSRLRLVFDALSAESGSNPYAPGDASWAFAARDPAQQPAVDAALAEMDAEIAAKPSGYVGQFSAIADRLDGRPSALVTGEDGVRSIELVAAIYHAARCRSHVSLPMDRSLPVCVDWVPGDISVA